MNKIYAFVYGTLMKNQRNHGYLKDAIYIGEGTIDGYQMYDLGTYPGIIKGKAGNVHELIQFTQWHSCEWSKGSADRYFARRMGL